MNDLISRMTGVREDVPVPVAAKRSESPRERKRSRTQLRTAAAIMGMSEGVGQAIIPDDAEEIDAVVGTTGLKIKDEATPEEPDKEPAAPQDKAGEEAPEEVITPTDILVAPDVTPDLFTQIDPSQVPEPEKKEPTPAPPPAQEQPEPPPAPQDRPDPLEVLLGRKSPQSTMPEPDKPVSVESEQAPSSAAAQAAVNASLGVSGAGGSSGDPLGRGQPMPDPVPGQTSKIVEAFKAFRP